MNFAGSMSVEKYADLRKGMGIIMTGIEVFLIIIGIIAIVCSFIFAERFDKTDKSINQNTAGVTETMVKEQIGKAVDHILNDKIEETEAKMDKLSNEKIMVVGDYSEAVLKDINKNHDEVMFLYGMLNDKEKEVKNAVRDIENVKKSISIIANEEMNKKILSDKEVSVSGKTEEETPVVENRIKGELKDEPKEFKISVKDPNAKNKGVVISHKEVKRSNNNNRRILDLYKEGRTNIEIAKELNLGMGEVRLVIDLYKNKK